MKIPNLVAVRGNHEGYLLGGLPENYTEDLKSKLMERSEFEYHKWEHSQLSEQSVDFLRGLHTNKNLLLVIKNSCYALLHER